VGPAKEGKLIFITSGDRELFDRAAPLMDVMGCKKMYLGQVDSSSMWMNAP
jgi:glyoxylate/succinic semialdehyde reductase